MSYATGLFHRHYTNFALLNTTSAVKISIITISGLSWLISFPNFYQLRGLIEFNLTLIFNPFGGGSSEYCVFPGKKIRILQTKSINRHLVSMID